MAADYTRHSRVGTAAFAGGHGRLQHDPDAVLRDRAAGPGHGGPRRHRTGNANLCSGRSSPCRVGGGWLRHTGRAGAGPVLRQRLLHRGVHPEPAAAVGPAGAGGRHHRADHRGWPSGPQHRRLRELPGPCWVRCSCRCSRCWSWTSSCCHEGTGTCPGAPVAVVDAPAVGPGFRRLPAHQPGLRVLVGVGLDLDPAQIGFTPASWMSASVGSFLVAALLTLAGGSAATLIRRWIAARS